ncbi:hypothetical protein WJX75_009972 [Coccomyxa subellipsoidea]|uniref:Stc1 domain-containing protein n=1 Tax=Coccomyxa subellipsoidea TaxID=248742 RepID=A0ABR2YUG4_9CHLO
MVQDPTLQHDYAAQLPIQKTCSKCKETKVASEFFKDKSKPDGMYSQCKACATAEERRRRESRPQVGPDMMKSTKKCTRCGIDKPASSFCRNKRSFDGLYSQCRTCVSDKDKDRRQKMLIQKPEPVPNKLCSRCNTQKTCEDFYRDASKPDGLQTYCKPCLCAKHKELRDRKRMRCIQAHLGATGQLHLDPAHIADPNADPYAGHHSYPVYNVDGSLQGHVTLADGSHADLDAAGLQAVYPDGVAQGYPIEEGAQEGQGEEQQYVLQQEEYDEQQGYHTGEEGFAVQVAAGSNQHADEQGYLAQQEGEEGYQEGEYIQEGAPQDYVHTDTDGYHLVQPQDYQPQGYHPDDADQVYEGEAHGYEEQHQDNSEAHHTHEELVLCLDEAVHGGGYVEEQRLLKRYRVR